MRIGLRDGEGVRVRMCSLDVDLTTGAYIIMDTIPKFSSGESISNNTFSRKIGHTYASFISVAHTNPCINYFQVFFRDLAKVLRDEKVQRVRIVLRFSYIVFALTLRPATSALTILSFMMRFGNNAARGKGLACENRPVLFLVFFWAEMAVTGFFRVDVSHTNPCTNDSRFPFAMWQKCCEVTRFSV